MTKISHREIATSFLRLAASGKVREAYSKYVARTSVTITLPSAVTVNR